MSDLDIGTLLQTTGKVLLAVLEFILSFIPIGILALISAWLVKFEDRAHFFQAKFPRWNVFENFLAGLGVAHTCVTFFFALLWGTDGVSAITIITYSVCFVWAVAIGVGLGCLVLGIFWNLAKRYVPGSSDAEASSYEAASGAEEHDLEAGARNQDVTPLESTKES